ncbi:hypothetical protein ACH347_04205 [Saccharopolyspora sp. 5N102]|uniref:hypothetical protein n=1 Tax=Saccharopolyspora sp. 5N102 TaxID=3375155 RepID=UPI00378FC853
MATKRTTTRSDPQLPDDAELERLKLSPEVAWYLANRGIPLPDCPPLVKTPEPRDAPGAVFDAERVDRVLRAFGALVHTQGQWAGRSLHPDPWQVAYVLAPVFGWVRHDEAADGYVRVVNGLYVEVPRKNGKSTLSGGSGARRVGRGWGVGEFGSQRPPGRQSAAGVALFASQNPASGGVAGLARCGCACIGGSNCSVSVFELTVDCRRPVHTAR